ncbi:uncharacterized protein LOC124365366 [Homalodisca vitripennis]|uniref:uncharacterized protein LOC124365366 n=1 Tax=Homalodisca vitripennis TaxID=197043 RepID=UPI001EE9EC7F|nr:uncharacterized protein LOC124365366 [Homalodisca vitripennis]
MNEKIGAIMNAGETSGTCVSVRLEQGGKSMQVISLYCRPSEPIDGHLTWLVDIIRKKGNKEVLCGGDLNARSGLWRSGSTDEKGSKVEDVVSAWDLQVLNKFSRWMTFENTQGGKSNIDVTIVTRDISSRIKDWTVQEETLSDHRLITMKVISDQENRGNQNEQRLGTYCLRKVNWTRFDEALRRSIEVMELETTTAEVHAEKITEMTLNLMENQFPKATKGMKKVYWWSEDLEKLRVKMRGKSRIWRKTGREVDRRAFYRIKNRIHLGNQEAEEEDVRKAHRRRRR